MTMKMASSVENTKIMRKIRDLEKDIEAVDFKYIGSAIENHGCSEHVLIEPDFQVVIGRTKSAIDIDSCSLRSICECFYGGEKMQCIARNQNCGNQKDAPDLYFENSDPKQCRDEKGVCKDIYTPCMVRKLAKIIANAYQQAKSDGEQK